jgi:hypothetical protein
VRTRVKVAAAVLTLLLARRVTAEPDAPVVPRTHVVTEEPRFLCVPPAPPVRCMDLPPGHFVDQNVWTALDTEIKRAQNAETRLAAENKALRESASGWQPGWRMLAGAILTGLAGGWYVHSKL